MAQTVDRDTGTEWISVSAAARLVQLATGTVYRKIREGELPAYTRAGRTFCRRADVAAFMAPRPIQPSPKRGNRR